MRTFLLSLLILPCVLTLSACGLGETAVTAELQAKQAQQAQQQMEQLKQQIDAVNVQANKRLQEQEQDSY
jgi:cell division protein FtsB